MNVLFNFGSDDDLFGGPGLFEDVPMNAPDLSLNPPDVSDIEKPSNDDTITEMPPPPGMSLCTHLPLLIFCNVMRHAIFGHSIIKHNFSGILDYRSDIQSRALLLLNSRVSNSHIVAKHVFACVYLALDSMSEGPSMAPSSVTQPTMSDTTLLANDEEAFALEPLDTTSVVAGTAISDFILQTSRSIPLRFSDTQVRKLLIV